MGDDHKTPGDKLGDAARFMRLGMESAERAPGFYTLMVREADRHDAMLRSAFKAFRFKQALIKGDW